MKNKIAYYRNKLGISQELLASKIEVSRPYLSDIENDKVNPSGEIVMRISREFKLPVEEIFFNPCVNYSEQSVI